MTTINLENKDDIIIDTDGYEIQIDMNVLNHLGMSLYSNTPAVLTEIISNAWDADANEVTINLDKANSEVVITDDGHGMTKEHIINRFLKVGYARRNDKREKSDSGKRQVMGRKGIGKLAMFSLAGKIQVTSKTIDSNATGFEIDVEELQRCIKKGEPYKAKPITLEFDAPKGTKIRLFDLKKSISRTESYLRKKLARRFSVIGPRENFEVIVNKTPISTDDRDFLKELQFIWQFGESDSYIRGACKKVVRESTLPDTINFEGAEYKVKGYIGGVKTPKILQQDPEVTNNTITIISNGRLFDEDILPEFGSAKHFTNYLVGELEIDLLDKNEENDMATSSRQKLQQEDPRYPVLKQFLDKTLSQIDKDWGKWRSEIGAEEVQQETPTIKKWFESLHDLERKAAENVIGKVNTMRFSGTTSEQERSKKAVLKNTVLAFEKLRIQKNLSKLDEISDVSSVMFKDVFATVNDIEESLYYEITSQRLSVVDKFQKITNDNELEKVVQEYLYDHLWLLDPSWERVSGSQEIERTLSAELKKIDPDAKTGARLDIEYKTISGKHIIIEMKKPDIIPSIEKLQQQGRKYVKAVRQWYKDHPDRCPIKDQTPQIEIIFLLGKNHKHLDEDDREYHQNILKALNAKIMTYGDLITQTRQTYSDYIDCQKESQRLKDIIDHI
ncbi:ATP-binding protein [Vibrio parahaemolyticus]|nr:ATP-binding protein [Vibrio parahaemolyticus]MDG3377167.1 ATP-binding protein [Vibrio parahaemolyticus]